MQVTKNLLRAICWSALLIISLVVMSIKQVYAAEPVVTCQPNNGYVFVYVNGVRTSPEEAATTMNKMVRSVVGTGLRKGAPVEFIQAYNPSPGPNQGLYTDTVETLGAKAVELGLDAVRAKAWFIAGHGVPLFQMTDAQRQELFRTAGELEVRLAAAAVDNASINLPELQQIIAKVRGIDPKKSLVVFGHSEGSVFTNLLYTALRGGTSPRDETSMRFLAAGAAAADVPGLIKTEIPGGEPWVTNINDVVINALRLARPNTLRGNFPGPRFNEDEDDSLGHNMVNIYLNPKYVFLAEIKSRIDIAFDRVLPPTDATSCKLVLNVAGEQPGWTVFPEVSLEGLAIANRSQFPSIGSPGNTCGGERGAPLYSQDVSIPITAKFYAATISNNAPYQLNRSPNRRPCSSFVAVDLVPDPDGVRLPKYRIWANATARAQSFSSSGGTLDTESQLRYDSGDPWANGNGGRCVAGTANAANFFGGVWNLTSCSAQLLPSQ